MSDSDKEEIQDDEEHQTTYKNQHLDEHRESKQEESQEPEKIQYKEQTLHMESNEEKKLELDHESISKYANFTLDIQNDEQNQIYLRIIGNETKGSTFTKYTAYIIKGHDKNGEINVYRRFSEFHALRTAMVLRWPGCFIPSIPTKNILHKNDPDQTVKRERYLNDFVIKMTKLPYLYNSQEFQTFLRSKQVDTSNIYSSWSNPTNEAIINKYRDCFSDLAGKQIDSSTNNTIGLFYARIKKNALLLEKYRVLAKNLALARDKFNQHYPILFSKIIPLYEKTILNEYGNGKEDCFVYQNAEQAKLSQHASIVKQTSNLNPYWQLYDMIKNEERDGRAFLQALEAREKFQSKRHSIQGKIRENQKSIIDLMEGKSNIKSVTSKGTKEEVKYKLQVENEELKKQKQLLFVLSDIISALIVYIEIPAYENAKANFYTKTIKKIGGFELNAVQIQADVWRDTEKSSKKVKSRNTKTN